METADMEAAVEDNEDYMESVREALNADMRAVVKAAGLSAALDIIRTLGGSTIYVPVLEEVERARRDRLIRRQYARGARVKDICLDYGLSERTVYKVLRRRDEGKSEGGAPETGADG